MTIPLEDNFADIIGKAQRGLRLADDELARRAALLPAQVAAVRSGQFSEPAVRALAAALGLGAEALAALGRKSWQPHDPGPIDGLASFNTPFQDMTVNSYLAFDPQSRAAAAFDTGADCDGMLEFCGKRGLTIGLILLTHIHTDHIFELDRLRMITGATAFVSDREPIAGAEPFADGREFRVGNLLVQTRRTSGHSRGGVTFVVTGLTRRLAVVGDALFAGSMGGGMVDYAEALRTNRANIFSLPDDTVVCPGHGPLTTVGEEKQHNPFFAG